MTKRKSLLSLVLALCLCFMLAVPALAAEDNVNFEKKEIQSIEQVSEDNGVQQFSVDIANETIEVYTDNVSVSEQQIEEYLNRALSAVVQETTVTLNNDDSECDDIIKYIYTDDENQIIYVEGKDDSGEFVKGMIVEANDTKEFNKEIMAESLLASDKTNIPDGIGIKAFVNETGQSISGKFKNCPPLNRDKLQNDKCGFYHYFGLTTNKLEDTDSNYAHADIGVIYSGHYSGWYPYMLLRQDNKTYMVDNTENKPGVTAVGKQVYQLADAGYGMTSPISMTIYKSTAAYKGSGTVVRLVTFGTSNKTHESNLKCIVDAGRGITDSVEYRVLTTITGNILPGSNSSAPRMEMNYYDVKVDGVTATWQSEMGTKSATITKRANGILAGKINFN